MSKRHDISGQKFNQLTVTSFSHTSPTRRAMWNCVCDCGGTTVVSLQNLRNEKVKTCGCIFTYLCQDEIYGVWRGMIQRCTNPNSEGWKHYGGRGITVCERWKLFKNFHEDMSPRPSPEYQLDRKNNDEGYSKDNCHWITGLENIQKAHAIKRSKS